MNLEKSNNLKKFKKQIGQVNHFLITILVGLDGIFYEDIDIRKEFSTSWKPKNKQRSVQRSREFAIKASLAWVTDCVDRYFRSINETPKLVQDHLLETQMNGNGQSIYRNYETMIKLYQIDSIESAFVDLLICWRNRLVHYKAENDISNLSRRILKKEKEFIQNQYCNLNTTVMLERFDQNKDTPTFKEATSLIKASISFITDLDQKIVNQLDQKKYIKEIVRKFILESPNNKQLLDKDQETRRRKIENILYNHSFNQEKNSQIDTCIDEITKETYKYFMDE